MNTKFYRFTIACALAGTLTLLAATAWGQNRPKAQAGQAAEPKAILEEVDAKLLAYDTAAAREALGSFAGGSSAGVLTAEGRVLAQEKKYDEAVAKLRQACEAAPADPAPWTHLGETFLYQKRDGDAKKAFQEAVGRARSGLTKASGNAAAHYHLGVAQLHLGDHGAARASLAEARRLDPGNPMPVYQMGRLAYEAGEHREAVDQLSAALDKSSGLAYAYLYRGLAASKAGRKDLLIADLSRFLKLAPEAPEAPLAQRIVASTRR